MSNPTSASATSPQPLTRVLVAEDDNATRSALVRLLEHHGFEVTEAADGQAASRVLFGPNPPQIVLLDWEMPHLDGIYLCCAVRSIPASPYTYMIMVTARDGAKDVLAAFGAGADDFLSKPVDSANLLARLRCGERVIELESRCAQRISELERAVDEVRQLKRLLPICMYCKKVRDDGDYWQEIETYIHAQTGTDFSHGICPECMDVVRKREMPDDPTVRVEAGIL
jgi:phosphoserine phosphatase RsbU/P